MQKDFDAWNEEKKTRNTAESSLYFYERDVWWCALGVNVGFEQDGKGEHFLRPILVLRKYSKHVFIGVPLSTTRRDSTYHYAFSFIGGISTALLSQIRLFDSKRLVSKMGKINRIDYEEIRRRVKAIL